MINKLEGRAPYSRAEEEVVNKQQATFVKVFYVNSEDLEKEINKWLADNEDSCEIKEIKQSSCYFDKSQTKAIVTIFYKPLQHKHKRIRIINS